MSDRLGPDAWLILKAAGWSVVGALMFIPVAANHNPTGLPPVVFVPLCVVLAWVGLTALSLTLIRPGVAVARFYLAPSGASTPYQEQFSAEQALVMQGRVPQALASFERRIAADPLGIPVRIRAAELYATLAANPARAAELFQEVQRLPGLSSGDEMYVGNRLADLYLGPLGTPSRALVELRRLLVRYPDSRMAPRLRQGLADLKARHLTDERPG
ncbi:MAG: hypothetical protein B7Z72_01240 [Gemmatimonadetes bacterium 21-71-4]|nr:MAG: hypothetical protein B7Z72_01240 [Gemmatimonadetes bacterium 21-71-4]